MLFNFYKESALLEYFSSVINIVPIVLKNFRLENRLYHKNTF